MQRLTRSAEAATAASAMSRPTSWNVLVGGVEGEHLAPDSANCVMSTRLADDWPLFLTVLPVLKPSRLSPVWLWWEPEHFTSS